VGRAQRRIWGVLSWLMIQSRCRHHSSAHHLNIATNSQSQTSRRKSTVRGKFSALAVIYTAPARDRRTLITRVPLLQGAAWQTGVTNRAAAQAAMAPSRSTPPPPPPLPAASDLSPLPKTVANERNQQQLNLIANNIGGESEQLRRRLAQVDAGAVTGLNVATQHKSLTIIQPPACVRVAPC
jgi:hypothetical protein